MDEEKNRLFESLKYEISQCKDCDLCKTRTHVVPGEGNLDSKILFVGEGPGGEEDKTGRPFVGPAGQLLDKMISAIGLKRSEVFIANVVKCRPPGNRIPEEEEAQACLPFLRKQFMIIRPKIIVCLGATAAKHLIDSGIRITKDRGTWYEKKGCKFIVTYHPSAVLRDESKKKDAWEDFKSIKKEWESLNL